MKKVILKFTLIALLIIASLAFVMIFAECDSLILGLLEKIALSATVLASMYGIDRLYRKYQTLK